MRDKSKLILKDEPIDKLEVRKGKEAFLRCTYNILDSKYNRLVIRATHRANRVAPIINHTNYVSPIIYDNTVGNTDF